MCLIGYQGTCALVEGIHGTWQWAAWRSKFEWIPGSRKVRKQTVVKYPARPSCAFYSFWRRLFRKEVRDDDHGVAGRGPDVQDLCTWFICQTHFLLNSEKEAKV